jgi:hypothetical protein
MLEDNGENMAARETMQTICNLRDRGKTWYGGGAGVWLSRLIDSAGVDGKVMSFSSRGDRLGLESTKFVVTRGSLRVSVELK